MDKATHPTTGKRYAQNGSAAERTGVRTRARAHEFSIMNDASSQHQSPRNQYRLTQPWKVQPTYLLPIAEAAATLGLTEGTLKRYCDRSVLGHLTVRWQYGIIARRRR